MTHKYEGKKRKPDRKKRRTGGRGLIRQGESHSTNGDRSGEEDRPCIQADALSANTGLFRAIMEASSVGLIILDRRGRVVSANARVADVLDVSFDFIAQEPDFLCRCKYTYLNGVPFPEKKLPLTRAIGTKMPVHGIRHTIVFPDDRRVSVSVNAVPVLDPEGHVDAVVMNIDDITAREEARAQLKRIKRALRIVSACNQVLLRASNELELLDTVCHTVERVGGFPVVWVGYARHDAGKSVLPVATAGRMARYLSGIEVSWGENDIGHGPAGKAIRTGKSTTARDIATNPDFLPWREKALNHGLAAVLAIPLTVTGKTIGALIIYSLHPEGFGPKESEILEQLAADLSYGIGALRAQEKHRQTQGKLNRTAEQLKVAVAASNTGLWDCDLQTNEVYYSPEWKRQLGYAEDELSNRMEEWKSRLHPDDIERIEATIAEFLADPSSGYANEFRLRHRDGTYRWILSHGAFIRDERGNPIRMVGSHVDITERREAEEHLRHTQLLLSETGRLAKIGGWEFDPATGKGTWTEEVARIHDLDPQAETSAELGLSFYHGESRTRIEDAIKRAIESATPYDLVLELTTAKGNHRWVRTVGRPIVRDGKVALIRGYFQDVSEMKQARDEISRLARYPNQNLYPVLRVDEAGLILYVNPATQSLLSSWQCRVGGRLPEPISSITARSLRENYALTAEIDCDDRTFLFAATPVATEKSAIVYGFDITAEKQVQRSLECSERRLGDALDLAKAADWEFDVATRTLTFNDRFYALYGTSAEREGGYTMPADEYTRRFLFPEDAHIVANGIARAIAESDPHAKWQLEHRILRRDGQTRFIFARITTIRDAQGRTIGAHGVNQDITERKLAEEERTRLAIALEQTAEAVVITDARGEIAYVNPAFERITGYQRHEVAGQNPRILKSGEQDDVFYRDLWETVGRGDVWSGRLRNKTKDGRIYDAEMTISPVVDEHGSAISYVAIQRDVTEQLALERRLLQSQKMEAIGTLAGGIAHDFNNILGAILGYGQLIADALPESGDLRNDIDELLKAVNRATELVRQILTFSRHVDEERKVIEMGLIVKEALKLLRPSIPTTIEIRAEIDVRGCPVLADPTQIHQVIVNICTNAYHAMQDSGGIMTVSVHPYGVDDAIADTHPSLHEGDYVRLSVRDTGHGIAQENLHRVFDPFFTTKPPGSGTGLGLATVHGIVTSHGGAISAYSEIDVGTTFHVYLPRAETGVIPELGPEEAVRGGREHILVVDDEEALVQLVERALHKLGYEVTAMTSPIDALEAIRAHPDSFDLLITDQTMPKLTGVKLVREVHRIRPGLPVVVATGHAGETIEEQLAQAGVTAILSKPAQLPEIGRIVRTVLDKK
jgi:PAS domain S-box-containing protein